MTDAPLSPQRFWINYWLPALGWNAAMAVFSTASFGAGNTGIFFRFILEDILHLHLAPAGFALVHFLVRKCAHFFGYALLSLVWFRLLAARRAGEVPSTSLGAGSRSHEGGVRPSWRWQWMAIALAICLVTGSADEIHQAFVPGRTSSWHDVALDMLGAIWMQSVLMITAQYVRRAKASR